MVVHDIQDKINDRRRHGVSFAVADVAVIEVKPASAKYSGGKIQLRLPVVDNITLKKTF